ncbi:unnamed protein product [Callosobruchus maculatus]|uniref:Uncharacterized protein n=1 Tax=Callosobruchus maculatus TaxID=64391 RepID=A0A653CDQ0_CALMS|nr:unnamed protein product [Callosobruchus maculatus]
MKFTISLLVLCVIGLVLSQNLVNAKDPAGDAEGTAGDGQAQGEGGAGQAEGGAGAAAGAGKK